MVRVLGTILLALLLKPDSINSNPAPADLLDGAIKAIGGAHAIESLESFKLHGMIRLPDGRPVIEIDLATFTGGKVLVVQTFIGIGQTRFGSDGQTAWEEIPNPTNSQDFKLIDEKTLSQKIRQLNWIEWLTSLPLELDNMTVQGETKFDGEACWILHISSNTEFDAGQQIFFSKTTKRVVGRQTIEHTNEGDAIVNVFFREWRPVGDLQLFHSVVFDRDGVEIAMVFDTIDVNSVDERIFTLPDPVIKLRDSK
ncbi:MAG: hypothetical protein QGI78_05495 [Phycisphaerales bacterium]|jgi:hypothetical protein|nr:hypothetical protein [Phycisphaerales bacterium]